ncbi:hypothetical protein HW132_02040 [Brasilonema sp. CT11]|nr:hypothetical protein [Brasilonema sp. CT11]
MIFQLQETHLCKANKRNQLLKAWSQLEPHNCEVDKKGRFYIYVGTPEAECKRLITPGLYDPFQWDSIYLAVMYAAAKHEINIVVSCSINQLFEVRLERGHETLAFGAKGTNPGYSALSAYVRFLWSNK